MKVFQIVDNIVYNDASKQFPTVASTVGRFPPSDIFVEAPDNVFEGWGFDPTKEGDERFIQPTPPDGWLYDEATGTFYPENEQPPNEPQNDGSTVSAAEMANAIREGVNDV